MKFRQKMNAILLKRLSIVSKRWLIDRKTPSGYLVAWLGQFAGSVACLITVVLCFDIVFGSSWLFIVIAEDITNDVTAFNSIVKLLKHKAKISNRTRLMRQLIDVIRVYTDAKQ